MLRAWHSFLSAVMFFTRIPVPKSTPHSPQLLNAASAWFPLIGWLVAGFAILIYHLGMLVWPHGLAVALSMVASIWLTGAFHEDGLADTMDGFGGGWDRDRILEIMKDSRLGTYGAVSLVMVLGIKWITLDEIPFTGIALSLWLGHSLSRTAALFLIRFGTYARADLQSKAKPLATRVSNGALLWGSLCGLLPLVFFPDLSVCWVLLPVCLVTLYLARWYKRWLGGYTGDCLGALQQITEVVIYLTLLGVVWKSG